MSNKQTHPLPIYSNPYSDIAQNQALFFLEPLCSLALFHKIFSQYMVKYWNVHQTGILTANCYSPDMLLCPEVIRESSIERTQTANRIIPLSAPATVVTITVRVSCSGLLCALQASCATSNPVHR
jgi:hypothetical protein